MKTAPSRPAGRRATRASARYGVDLRGRFEAGVLGCGGRQVWLETFSFQAPRFCARSGYGLDFRREIFPHGIAEFDMARRPGGSAGTF